MSTDKSQIKYPLLPFSQLVYEMTSWMPGVYRFPVTLRWKNGACEKDLIEQAISKALMNHPVFAIRIDRHGMHYPSDIQDVLQGKFHCFALTEEGNDLIINAELSRILGDGKSAEILLEDIAQVYDGKTPKPDDYWGYVARFEQQKQSSHYRISHDWLVKEFADSSVPVRPTIDRRYLFTLFPPKAGLYVDDYTRLHESINSFCKENILSFEGFFSLCTALAIAEYCGTDEAALTWAYEGRETPDEQRIFGSLHRDIPFRISRQSIVEGQKLASREELIKNARNQIRSGIAHSDYPYTLSAPYSKRWNYAVNVLRGFEVEDIVGDIDLPLEIVSVPQQKYAYALLDVEIHEKAESLQLAYRYSATHYKESSIRRFAALVNKNVEWLMEE